MNHIGQQIVLKEFGKMIKDYRKMKDEMKSKGEIPEWYSSNALQFFMDKYSYEGESVKSRDKTVAKTLAKFAPEKKPKWWEKDPYTKGKSYEEVFFNVIWDGYAVPSTPLKSNAGLPTRGLTVSCCGQHMENNLASKAFVRGELEVLIKNSHGCSLSVSDWLSEGTVYDSDGNISDGIIPVIDDLQDSTEAVSQNIRRGQTLLAVNVLHGDFDKVANKLYAESDSLNISWLITDEFVGLLKNGDKEAVRKFGRILQIRMRSGKGYLTFIDKMNRNKAQVFKDNNLKVQASNLCVAPETKVLTREGYEVIGDLEGQEVDVWNGQEWSTTTVVKTGTNQKLIKVSTNFNQEIECTPYHKFYVQVGSPRRGGGVVVKQAQDLKQGDKLIKFELPIIEGTEVFNSAYTNGFYSGDGCFYNGKGFVYLYHDKQKLLDKMQNVKKVHTDEKQNRQTVYFKEGTLKDKYFVPLDNYTIKSRLEWLAGICDSDGTVSRNGTNESLQISSTQLTFLQEIQLMLQTLGVTSTINEACEEGWKDMPLNDGSGETGKFFCQKAYRLLINSNSLFSLSELGFETNRLQWNKRKPHRECNRFMTIKSVEDLGRTDDTYCFTEPKRNMGMFNGILTGQCNEVNLPANEEYSFTCVIINANLAVYDDFPEHLFHILHIMQDCNVSNYISEIEKKTGLNALFLSKVLKFTKDFRAVGTGVCGFHSYLMKKRIVFGSMESMLVNEQIFKRMKEEITDTSKWLASVLGEPPMMKGTGLRNATTMMMPPTKSSAELAKDSPTESINPETALIRVKETVGGDIFRINTELLKVMKELGQYNKENVAFIAENKGSVQKCDWMPQELKDVFRNAFEIPMEAHLDLCSQRQKHIDQQQSINLYFSGDDKPEYIAEMHKKAMLDDWCNGLYYCYSSRGGSYERFGCEMCE